MKKTLVLFLLICTFLAACAPATTPAPTADIAATVKALSGTMVASTLEAMPTQTQIPSETPVPSPTATLEPLMTDTFTPAPTLIATGTATSEAFVGCFAPAGTGSIKVGIFRFELDTKQSAEVYLHGVSLNGNKTVDCSYTVTQSFNTEIIFGNYDYSVVVGNKTMTGSFPLVNDDKTTMRIFDKKVVVVGP
jgi:hypothetical protein